MLSPDLSDETSGDTHESSPCLHPIIKDGVGWSHLSSQLEEERARRSEAEAAVARAERQLRQVEVAHISEIHSLKLRVHLLQQSLAAARGDAEASECAQLLQAQGQLIEERTRLEEELQQAGPPYLSGLEPDPTTPSHPMVGC